MTQCTFRKLKQFTILFFFSWALVVFFANQTQLIQTFAKQILTQNQLTNQRAQKAIEFFQAHQSDQTEDIDEAEVNATQYKNGQPTTETSSPFQQSEEKTETETPKGQIVIAQEVTNEDEIAVAPAQIKQTVSQTVGQAQEKPIEKAQKTEQAKQTKTKSAQKAQKQQKKADEDKKQKEVSKKPVQNQKSEQKTGKREEKKSEKQQKDAKKEKVQSKQQKSQKPQKANKEERESQKTDKSGKKAQKNKKE